MIAFACLVAIAATCAALLFSLYRLLRGPDAVDRILALDTMVINAIGLVVLMGIVFATKMHFEASLLFAMVGFLSTVAFCKFLLRGNVIE